MTNKEVYRKTLTFSLRRFIFNTLCVVALSALSVAGFAVMEKINDQGILGLGAGLLIGIILIAIVSHFFSYVFKAGQIAMMTRAVTEGSLPDDVYGEGKRIVKSRFLTVAAFYAVTSAIKGIFNQIGNGITKLGDAMGGDTGKTIGSAISIAINVVVGFLCDCCLGWVFYRSDTGAVKATCEGAVIFFKHGKALLKNLGRIFGMGIISLLLIGGAFSGVNYLILSRFPELFRRLSSEIISMSSSTPPEWVTNPTNLCLITAILIGLIFWAIIHSVFIRPFILVGVLRNYMEAGMADVPQESSFSELDKVSPKFAKLRQDI